jgi:hypothetical protein
MKAPRGLVTVSVIHFAVMPRLLMPPAIVLTIVIAFLISLGVAAVMDDLFVVNYAAC